ncbi:MAG TPA: CocE/NonD family hydrolase [Solirubrobacteraceae bacterium]|nr:CocE/NonD family hydrolase [Solirubrobacteraceae bacterium]
MAREAVVFRLCVLVVAVHLVDDSFLQPQPGTSAGDHLASGLLPIAVLALAGWAYPRLRAGLRATIALVLGPLGIIAGAEAVRYMSGPGLSGDDYTGLLAIPAGVALLGLGTVTLWRTRRRDDGLPRRYARRASLTVGGLLVAVWVVIPLMLAYGVTHIARPLQRVADLGVAHERVTLTTSDGLRLAGLYVPSRNGAAVIAFPGRNGPQRHARMLARHGYGVLLVDRRGEGGSEGDPQGFGWTFDKDILAGVAFLERRRDVDPGRIGGLGLSVGGEMMLQTAAESEGLAAVVSEGAGARVISEELDDLAGVQKWLMLPHFATKTASLAVFSNHAPPANLTKLIPRIAPRPVFLINAAHGEVDDKTPEYFRAAKEPKSTWAVPAGRHTGGITARPEEYERRVVGFFDRALGR